MNIHEHQAKDLIKKFGAPVSKGVVILNLNEIDEKIKQLNSKMYVVKAQIHAGGRGKAGGVKLVKNIDELKQKCKDLLGKVLITHQTGPQGREVKRLYIEEASDIKKEFYLSCLVDRAFSKIAFISSAEGGMDVEEVADKTPEKIITTRVSLSAKLKDEDLEYGNILTYHKQIEALKIAFSDTLTYVTDPLFMKMNPTFLLSDDYVKLRKKDITDEALLHKPITYESSGTVYLATADNEGNMVSFIQSNYMGFGSGIVIEGTGISMQNRGHTFKLDENHHNKLEPRKRTYHTIIPGFLMKDGKAVGPFGVMGGFMQPQGHVQVMMRMIDFAQNPQAALDAPRWQWMQGKSIQLEPGFSDATIAELRRRGHEITIADARTVTFGRGQAIVRMSDGWMGASDLRADGIVAAR